MRIALLTNPQTSRVYEPIESWTGNAGAVHRRVRVDR